LAMTEKVSVNSASRLSEVISKITSMYRDHKFLVVTIKPGKDRTLDQNRLWFAFYKRIADMTQIGDASEARKHCKLHHGVQILLNSDPEFQASWYRVMRHLTYEEKLDMMGDSKLFGPDGMPVTSLFNRAQGIAYTERIVEDFTKQEKRFEPSTDWAQGGPLIDKFGVLLSPKESPIHVNGGPNGGWRESGSWGATIFRKGEHRRKAHNHESDPLVAAMRCVVGWCIGDTVSVPKELLS